MSLDCAWCEATKQAAVYLGGALLAYKLLSLTVSILSSLYALFLRPSVNLKKYGHWAVVTGCTDGIGREYALELARKKVNLILISRTQSKLDEVEKEIKGRFPVEVKTIAANFSTFSDDLYKTLGQALNGLDIGILVNNVGISYDFPEYYNELSEQRLDELVQVNIISVNKMTKLVLPGMVERKRGAIINVASGSATISCPLLTAYAASKAYAINFSNALRYEYESKGIFIQTLIPFFVASKMSKMKPSVFSPAASTYVKAAVSTIGHEHVTSAYWFHKVLRYFSETLPTWFTATRTLAMHKGFRARALKKIEREAKKQ